MKTLGSITTILGAHLVSAEPNTTLSYREHFTRNFTCLEPSTKLSLQLSIITIKYINV